MAHDDAGNGPGPALPPPDPQWQGTSEALLEDIAEASSAAEDRIHRQTLHEDSNYAAARRFSSRATSLVGMSVPSWHSSASDTDSIQPSLACRRQVYLMDHPASLYGWPNDVPQPAHLEIAARAQRKGQEEHSHTHISNTTENVAHLDMPPNLALSDEAFYPSPTHPGKRQRSPSPDMQSKRMSVGTDASSDYLRLMSPPSPLEPGDMRGYFQDDVNGTNDQTKPLSPSVSSVHEPYEPDGTSNAHNKESVSFTDDKNRALRLLPQMATEFALSAPETQAYIMFNLMRVSHVRTLQMMHRVAKHSLATDFIAALPSELGLKILGLLDAPSLGSAACVSRTWNNLVRSNGALWLNLLRRERLCVGDGLHDRDLAYGFNVRRYAVRASLNDNPALHLPGSASSPFSASAPPLYEEHPNDAMDPPELPNQDPMLVPTPIDREPGPVGNGDGFLVAVTALHRTRTLRRAGRRSLRANELRDAFLRGGDAAPQRIEEPQRRPETGLENGPEVEAGHGPGPEAEPVTGPVTGHGPGPEAEAVTGPLRGHGTGPEAEAVTGPVTGHGPGPEAEAVAGPEEGLEADPGPMTASTTNDGQAGRGTEWNAEPAPAPAPAPASAFSDAEPNTSPIPLMINTALPIAKPTSQVNPSPISLEYTQEEPTAEELAALGAPPEEPTEHPYARLFRARYSSIKQWHLGVPKTTFLPCVNAAMVTCIKFARNYVIVAWNDSNIHVYSTQTGKELFVLRGHSGDVWAIDFVGDTLVSGSTDRSIRIWDLGTGRCTHVFSGHTSTVRCLQIVVPELETRSDGSQVWAPAYPLVVSGSRDFTLRVWILPIRGTIAVSANQDNAHLRPLDRLAPEPSPDPRFLLGHVPALENPFHRYVLMGHAEAVRSLSARKNVLVSGSYDASIRVWDLDSGTLKHHLQGHSQRLYAVALDLSREICVSGSLDNTVRIWSIATGKQLHVLHGHQNLVGLIGISSDHIVSAAADSTLRIWDPCTGEARSTLFVQSGPITCFQHDDFRVISGSDTALKMWDARDGSFVRDLLTGLSGVWQVAFDERYCIAAVKRGRTTEIAMLDFGEAP